jgi:glyoxylase-like metal-dependent hydrolase (beta-lactamase superfamily II)
MVSITQPTTRRELIGAALGCASLAALTPNQLFAGEADQASRNNRPEVQFEQLAEGIWRHISWCGDEGGYWPSNGLVIIHGDQGILIDTPCTEADTIALLDRIKGVRLTELIITHAHGDRMAGIDVTKARGIPSFAYEASLGIAIKRDLGVIDKGWAGDKGRTGYKGGAGPVHRFRFGGRQIELYYPGPAHTADNTVLYVKDCKLLYGACMVRALTATNPGGLESADLCRWPQSLQNLATRYKNARIVVPGHGDPGGLNLLAHTAKLVEAARKEQGVTGC